MTGPALPPGYFTRPNRARVYDYWLDGKDNYGVDREAAEEMTQACPGLRVAARENRAFILGAVEWVARNRGVRQFLDLGCGLPARPAIHDAAREVTEDAAVAYVDSDPLVMSHVRALEAGPGLAAVEADVRDVEAVLGDGEVAGVIDLAWPVCVILGGTLSYMSPSEAQKAVGGYMEALAPGSAAIISCVHLDDQELADRIAGMFSAAGTWQNHGLQDVEGFFDAASLQVVRTHPADCRRSPLLLPGSGPGLALLGGVGIRP